MAHEDVPRPKTEQEPSPEKRVSGPAPEYTDELERGTEGRRKEIMESAQRERGRILDGIVDSPEFDTAVGFAGGKLEQLFKKHVSERRAPDAGRKNVIVQRGIGMAFKVAAASGFEKKVQGPIITGKSASLLKKGASLAGTRAPAIAGILAVTGKFLEDHPVLAKKAEQYADDALRKTYFKAQTATTGS